MNQDSDINFQTEGLFLEVAVNGTFLARILESFPLKVA